MNIIDDFLNLKLQYSGENTAEADKNAARILQNYGLLDITLIHTITGAPIQSLYKRNEFGEFFLNNFASE